MSDVELEPLPSLELIKDRILFAMKRANLRRPITGCLQIDDRNRGRRHDIEHPARDFAPLTHGRGEEALIGRGGTPFRECGKGYSTTAARPRQLIGAGRGGGVRADQ